VLTATYGYRGGAGGQSALVLLVVYGYFLLFEEAEDSLSYAASAVAALREPAPRGL